MLLGIYTLNAVIGNLVLCCKSMIALIQDKSATAGRVDPGLNQAGLCK